MFEQARLGSNIWLQIAHRAAGQTKVVPKERLELSRP